MSVPHMLDFSMKHTDNLFPGNLCHFLESSSELSHKI